MLDPPVGPKFGNTGDRARRDFSTKASPSSCHSSGKTFHSRAFSERLRRHMNDSSVVTYLYDGDGMKRVEQLDGARTTIVWDGQDYLQTRS